MPRVSLVQVTNPTCALGRWDWPGGNGWAEYLCRSYLNNMHVADVARFIREADVQARNLGVENRWSVVRLQGMDCSGADLRGLSQESVDGLIWQGLRPRVDRGIRIPASLTAARQTFTTQGYLLPLNAPPSFLHATGLQINPSTMRRTVGLEIEVSGGERGLAVLPEWARPLLHVGTDGSIRGPEGSTLTPIELRTPVYTPDCDSQVRRVFGLLRRLGATVNHTCGGHIHVYANDVADAVGDRATDATHRLWALYGLQEDYLYSLNPGRINNQYCAPHGLSRAQCIAGTIPIYSGLIPNAVRDISQHYVGLNVRDAMRHFRTVEFRFWNATLDPREAIRRMRYGRGLIDLAVAGGAEYDRIKQYAVRGSQIKCFREIVKVGSV